MASFIPVGTSASFPTVASSPQPQSHAKNKNRCKNLEAFLYLHFSAHSSNPDAKCQIPPYSLQPAPFLNPTLSSTFLTSHLSFF